MGLFSGNPNKIKQIELQNIIFDTNEKKLMVSNEFLDEMTTHYISKRMKSVNHMMESLVTTKNVKTFFTCYDSIVENLDELIKLEKYHTFKKPVPSVFKGDLEAKKEKYIQSMINRVWKDANMKANFDPTIDAKRDPEKFGHVLSDILEYKDRYSSSQVGHIDRFYKSVYGRGMDEKPEIPETEEEETPVETAPEETAELPEEDDDGIMDFIPEDFGDDDDLSGFGL